MIESTQPTPPARPPTVDRGFTLVEVLIVIVILGLLSVAVVFSVRGVVDRGEKSSCAMDAKTLVTAGEAYLAQNAASEIPAAGDPGDLDAYEHTLVEAGLLRDVSALHELDSDATVVSSSATCP